jgi:ubiquinone/menaquinone biosynthesis C-methylase UbiE
MHIPWVDKRNFIQMILRGCKNPLKVVDIGCGLTPYFIDSVNVDNVSPSYWVDKLERQRREGVIKDDFYSLNLKTCEDMMRHRFVQADIKNLPFKNGSFDFAIVSELLEHIPNYYEAVDEVQRVAKVLIIAVPNEYQWTEDKKPFSHPDHVNYFTEENLFELVEKTGLCHPELIKVCLQGWSHFILIAVSKHAKLNF